MSGSRPLRSPISPSANAPPWPHFRIGIVEDAHQRFNAFYEPTRPTAKRGAAPNARFAVGQEPDQIWRRRRWGW
jgi:hypothetical protein